MTAIKYPALVFLGFPAALADGGSVATPPPAPRFWQTAQPAQFPPDTPRLSDVCMRLFAVRGDVTAERIIAAGKAYHITRGVWS